MMIKMLQWTRHVKYIQKLVEEGRKFSGTKPSRQVPDPLTLVMYNAIIGIVRLVRSGFTRRRLRRLVRLFVVDMIVIFKPRITRNNLVPLLASLGFDNVCSYAEWNGKVWVMWNYNIIVQ